MRHDAFQLCTEAEHDVDRLADRLSRLPLRDLVDLGDGLVWFRNGRPDCYFTAPDGRFEDVEVLADLIVARCNELADDVAEDDALGRTFVGVAS